MIRGIMEYSLEAPDITNLKEVNYVNKDSIKVEGSVIKDAQVNIYINGEKALEVQSKNRKFSGEVELPKDENNITVTAAANGKETEPSTPVKVIKDKTPPELNILSPEEGMKTNKEVVHIVGSGIEMIEEEPGFYKGTWTVPKGVSIKEAIEED